MLCCTLAYVRRPDAIIFDCYGVLYPQAYGDYFVQHAAAFSGARHLIEELGEKVDLGQINRAEYFRTLGHVAGIDPRLMQAEIDERLRPDLALVAFIGRLKPSYKIGLLSNAGPEEIEIVYRDRLDGLFDAVTVSYEAGTTKPDPAIFLTCAERLAMPPKSCLFVDDSAGNIAGAREVGMQTVHYPQFGAIPPELWALGGS